MQRQDRRQDSESSFASLRALPVVSVIAPQGFLGRASDSILVHVVTPFVDDHPAQPLPANRAIREHTEITALPADSETTQTPGFPLGRAPSGRRPAVAECSCWAIRRTKAVDL